MQPDPISAPDLAPDRAPAGRLLMVGLLVLVAGFALYQISSGIALVLILLGQGLAPAELMTVLQNGLLDHPYAALVANAVGQFVGLAAVALLAARLTTPHVSEFLRFRRPDGQHVLVAVAGALCLVPLVQVLSDVNRLLPIPDWLAEMERSQLVLLEAVLGDPGGWFFNVLLLAATPAICEELLFRGYFQRQVGRAVSAPAAILLSGLLFGLYHLRPTQLLPLALLGIYLAYVVWRTDSVVTGIAVHFVYNGLLVLSAPYLEGGTDPDAGPVFPIYLVLLGLLGFAALMFWLHPRGRADAPPVLVQGEAYSASTSPEPRSHE